MVHTLDSTVCYGLGVWDSTDVDLIDLFLVSQPQQPSLGGVEK